MNTTCGVILGLGLVALAWLHQGCARAAGRRLPTPGGVVLVAVGLFTAIPATVHMTL